MDTKKTDPAECGPPGRWEPLSPYVGAMVCRGKHLHLFPEIILREAGFKVTPANVAQLETTFEQIARDRGLTISLVEEPPAP